MPYYLVTWEIDVDDVATPREAAQKALAIHRKPDSIATVFTIRDKETGVETVVDLTPEESI